MDSQQYGKLFSFIWNIANEATEPGRRERAFAWATAIGLQRKT